MAAAQERLTTTISTKGQVILPKAVRDLRHWPAGTRLVVESTAEGVLLKLAPVFPPSSIDQVFGSLKHKGAALSIEDMETAMVAEAKRRARD
ncbi:AbrB/MazE/SpoVT family DNA-binding domain-containing protein [Sphingosinicella microcystinivorans]|uniref:AbrB/MazE/SpoVT family DNA-binding domain-containing protein n=1 Tax=Sphingosinicella microcystinivorans TaxID=335406 RepID=UPI0022F3F8F2|nr:AbrB/MazE/SpoVT family DNA-binding domain-containing protein [Sphingosinicella microcystinivorans]WBX84149.1 AbrB/MazE/SpoVT family DNA-binding domain-containing protein [Sphingosinicella microcystinivorans]